MMRGWPLESSRMRTAVSGAFRVRVCALVGPVAISTYALPYCSVMCAVPSLSTPRSLGKKWYRVVYAVEVQCAASVHLVSHDARVSCVAPDGNATQDVPWASMASGIASGTGPPPGTAPSERRVNVQLAVAVQSSSHDA